MEQGTFKYTSSVHTASRRSQLWSSPILALISRSRHYSFTMTIRASRPLLAMRIHNPGGGSTSTWAARDFACTCAACPRSIGTSQPKAVSRDWNHVNATASTWEERGALPPCRIPLQCNRNTNTQTTQRFLEARWDPQHGPHLEGSSKAARRSRGTVHKTCLGRAAGDNSGCRQRAPA
ncbi:hypothetical protein CFE70_000149 [Pyrenophora teres f. teres 0-1]